MAEDVPENHVVSEEVAMLTGVTEPATVADPTLVWQYVGHAPPTAHCTDKVKGPMSPIELCSIDVERYLPCTICKT